MPKVKPLGSEEMKRRMSAISAAAERGKAEDARIQEDLRVLKAATKLNHIQLAGTLGMKPCTWRYRRENPQSFKLSEIRVVQELARQYGREVRFG